MSFDKPIGFFVFDYAWIFLILVTTINALVLKVHSSRIVKEHPELQGGYDQLFKGYIIYMNIPWAIMGIGMVFGGVPSAFNFFTPRHGNIFVIPFHASIVILWFLGIWWVYFKGGAEFLNKYKGIFNRDFSANFIKVYFGVCLIGGILGMIVMWSL
jgi:hypothetical protein